MATDVQPAPAITTFLFTDIEGSSRLWESDPARMGAALSGHDAIVRQAVRDNRGNIVKMTGDGVHAAFADPLDGVRAALQLLSMLTDPAKTNDVALHVRCGLHAGVEERRDNDFFGNAVNRAARIMSTAHGGQILLSQAVATLVRDRLPPGVALLDLGSVRLRDLANPERIYQVVHPQLRQEFPALRSLEATPNNLPQQITSFIGRGRELAEAKGLLGSARLLTLFGVGGIGKTRLSLQLAADVMDDYPDGVWFVELAPVANELGVPHAVASTVGVKETPGHPLLDALVRYVKDRKLLLILDNCEHLVAACARLATQLLKSGPNLKILASSREHLNIAGETTFLVPALASADPQRKLVAAALSEYDATRLFVDRASAVQPAFKVSDKNAAAVADICHRLDGIPLAIELAAARVRALSVETIAARLSDRFRLLVGGDRSALPRQQTLRALIDWSYDLLTERERAVLRRLAVFAGGWTIEGAEAVVPDGDVQGADVLELLTNLVEKSLVVVDPVGGRYRLLDTVRQYAQERLDRSGEASDTSTRHLAFFLALAEEARPALAGPEQAAWLARLDLERENLLAAHAWCDRAKGGGELGLRLVHAVKPYWFTRGLLGLGHRVSVEAVGRETARGHTLARCRALHSAGQLGCAMGHYGEARAYLEESLKIAREIGDRARVAAVLQPLGIAALGQGDVSTARGHLEEALALARELGNRRELAAALNQLAQLHRAEGALDAAEPLYAQVLTLARELGDRETVAIGLLNLAIVAIGRGSDDGVPTMLLEALAIAEEIGSKSVGQSVLDLAAGLGASRAEWALAGLFFGAAEKQAERTGLRRDRADEAFLTPLIAKARIALGTAGFAVAAANGCGLSYEETIGQARAWLGTDNEPLDLGVASRKGSDATKLGR